MSAAMPTVVADLGGLDLYSWVYSAYLLTRTVCLPIFGKLADIYRTKTLYAVSIVIFIAASLAAGFAESMGFLIACRALQGIGAGGNFALVYIVLADISPPEERAKTLSLGSHDLMIGLNGMDSQGKTLAKTRVYVRANVVDDLAVVPSPLSFGVGVVGRDHELAAVGRDVHARPAEVRRDAHEAARPVTDEEAVGDDGRVRDGLRLDTVLLVDSTRKKTSGTIYFAAPTLISRNVPNPKP